MEKQAARFVNNMRTLYKKGSLPKERQELLMQIPCWSWDVQDAAWSTQFAALRNWLGQSLAEESNARPRYPSLSAKTVDERRLADWVKKQHLAYHSAKDRATLSEQRKSLLEIEMPYWTWQGSCKATWDDYFACLRNPNTHEHAHTHAHVHALTREHTHL